MVFLSYTHSMAERKEELLNNQTVEQGRRREGVKIIDRLVPRDRRDHEVESWLTKIEEDPAQIQDQQMGSAATNLQAVSQKADDIYQVPITKRNFVDGFKQSLDEAAKWLSVFILRIVKKKQGKVKFKQENE